MVLGFLDTGIRYDDEVFRNPDGSSRILGIWDQNINDGPTPEGLLYGTEYKKNLIDAALLSENPREIVPSYDEIGPRDGRGQRGGRKRHQRRAAVHRGRLRTPTLR